MRKRILFAAVIGIVVISLTSCLSMIGSLLDDLPEDTATTQDQVNREAESPTTKEKSTTVSGEIRPNVKAAIDSYEEFVDKYCEFMSAYDPTDISKLLQYTDLIQEEAKMTKAFEELDAELTDAEALYYAEVSLRCSQKMLKASVSIFG